MCVSEMDAHTCNRHVCMANWGFSLQLRPKMPMLIVKLIIHATMMRS